MITILNKKDGSYAGTIDLKEQLVDLAPWEGRLALATSRGLRVLSVD